MMAAGEICEGSVRGVVSCCEGLEGCPLLHSSLPYCWQIDFGNQGLFVNLPTDCAVDLESAFCNPACDDVTLEGLQSCSVEAGSQCTGTLKVDLNSLKAVLLCSSNEPCWAQLKRLSTPSYVQFAPPSPASERSGDDENEKLYLTQWRWYYLNGTDWKMFGEAVTQPSQAVLEAKYVCGRQELYRFELKSEGEFLVDLRSLQLVRLSTGEVWRVRRRPLLIIPHDVTFRKSHVSPHVERVQFETWLPKNWSPVDPMQEAEMVPINPDSLEYHLVASAFHSSLLPSMRNICDLFRIQNPFVWHKYVSKKLYVEKRNGKSLNEEQLFHGTRDHDAVRAIVKHNFDVRLHASANATLYGKGVYFARDAQLSDKYALVRADATEARGRRSWMFLVRCILGKTTLGTPDLVRPPPLDHSRPHDGLYDSCTNSLNHPRLYVIFDSDQCYPEYAISYITCETATPGK